MGWLKKAFKKVGEVATAPVRLVTAPLAPVAKIASPVTNLIGIDPTKTVNYLDNVAAWKHTNSDDLKGAAIEAGKMGLVAATGMGATSLMTGAVGMSALNNISGGGSDMNLLAQASEAYNAYQNGGIGALANTSFANSIGNLLEKKIQPTPQIEPQKTIVMPPPQQSSSMKKYFIIGGGLLLAFFAFLFLRRGRK